VANYPAAQEGEEIHAAAYMARSSSVPRFLLFKRTTCQMSIKFEVKHGHFGAFACTKL
jgi:hypothetical protein